MSAIVRDDTAELSVVKPKPVSTDSPGAALERERKQARDDGYATGCAEARGEVTQAAERAQRHARAKLDFALSALKDATEQGLQLLSSERSRLEQSAADLSFKIAEMIIARELDVSVVPGYEALHRALDGISTADSTIIRLHPDDLATLDEHDLSASAMNIVGDQSVGRGGCVLEFTDAIVDARIDQALRRVREVLDRGTT